MLKYSDTFRRSVEECNGVAKILYVGFEQRENNLTFLQKRAFKGCVGGLLGFVNSSMSVQTDELKASLMFDIPFTTVRSTANLLQLAAAAV